MSNRIGTSLIAYVGFGALFFAAGIAPFAGAQAAVVVSSAQTQNMSCAAGVCVPTASNAVLNVSDLEAMLATGNVEVTTTGSGVQAGNIVVSASLGWSTTSALAFDAYQSITISRTVSVNGPSALSLRTNDGGSGGSLSFGKKGHAVFQNLSSQLSINGNGYVLVNSVKSLASAVANDPSGFYALANDYDASADGTYNASPVQTVFTGILEGLGNSISDLSIDASGYVGLFSFVDGAVENVGVVDFNIKAGGGTIAGGLASEGTHLTRVFVTGTIRGVGNTGGSIGGLVGIGGAITDCSARVHVAVNGSSSVAGGLAAYGAGVDESFSAGRVWARDRAVVGGLVGVNSEIPLQNSYATGAVTGGAHAKVGGLVGENGGGRNMTGTIETSYSTGAVSGGHPSKVGGFAGVPYETRKQHSIQQSYWDTTTSGTNQGTGRGNKRGLTGLTTQELQSGLPVGFDPKVWAENPKINNGFPYLIANPPRE